jgi:hypothetical protein
MTSKFSRFLHLERSRADRVAPEEPTQLQNGQRFEGVAGPREAPQEASVPEAHLERFKLQGETPLALVDPAHKAEHFPRCARCEAENGGFAQVCSVCGADLTTPQQREYNERLRANRQQAVADEQAAREAFAQQRKQREEDSARYSQLLLQTRMQEQGGRLRQVMAQHRSFGLGLLALIPNPALRWAILAGAILLPGLLFLFGRGMTQFTGLVLGMIVLMLLLARTRV